MTDQQILENDWNAVKAKLRQRWGQLTDSDLPQIRGDLGHLVGIIQRKTGEGREAIEAYLQGMCGSPPPRWARRPKRPATTHSTLLGRCRIRPGRPPAGPAAIRKRNASCATGRESRCWYLLEQACLPGW